MCFFYRLFLKYLLNIPSQQNDLYLNPLSLIKSYTINPANMHTNSYFFFSRMIEDWYWCSQQLYCSTSFQTQSVRNSGRCCQVLLLLFFWFGVRLSSFSKARASFISLVDVRFGDACRAGVDRTCVCNEVVYKNLSATVCVCVCEWHWHWKSLKMWLEYCEITVIVFYFEEKSLEIFKVKWTEAAFLSCENFLVEADKAGPQDEHVHILQDKTHTSG